MTPSFAWPSGGHRGSPGPCPSAAPRRSHGLHINRRSVPGAPPSPRRYLPTAMVRIRRRGRGVPAKKPGESSGIRSDSRRSIFIGSSDPSPFATRGASAARIPRRPEARRRLDTSPHRAVPLTDTRDAAEGAVGCLRTLPSAVCQCGVVPVDLRPGSAPPFPPRGERGRGAPPYPVADSFISPGGGDTDRATLAIDVCEK